MDPCKTLSPVCGDQMALYNESLQFLHRNNAYLVGISVDGKCIGIWTDHTFDYLNPSIAQANIYLKEIGRQEWSIEISQMIYWHHKFTRYKGVHEETVEIFRKADWIDVSFSLLTFGFDKEKFRTVRKVYPNAGFHVFLLKQSVKNFFRHPLNPVQVFKR